MPFGHISFVWLIEKKINWKEVRIWCLSAEYVRYYETFVRDKTEYGWDYIFDEISLLRSLPEDYSRPPA